MLKQFRKYSSCLELVKKTLESLLREKQDKIDCKHRKLYILNIIAKIYRVPLPQKKSHHQLSRFVV